MEPVWATADYPWSELLWPEGDPAGKGRMEFGAAVQCGHALVSWIYARWALVTLAAWKHDRSQSSLRHRQGSQSEKPRCRFPHLLLQMPIVIPGPTWQKHKKPGIQRWACSILPYRRFPVTACLSMWHAEVQMRKRTSERWPNLLGFVLK